MTARRSDRATDPLADRLIEPVPGGFALSIRSVVWLVVQMAAATVGRLLVVALYAPVAGIAGAQTARCWRSAGLRSHQGVAGWGAFGVTVASVAGLMWAGSGLFVVVVAALVAGGLKPGPGGLLASAGATVRSALGPAVVGVSVVQLAGISWSLLVMLIVLAAGYDVACNVWSSDGAGLLIGRVVGIATVAVLTVASTAVHTVFRIDPFMSTWAVAVFAGMAAVLFPLGPMAASALLPAANAWAPAFRRLDSLLVTAPVWMAAMWGYLG
jgi:hypothetical protein